MLQSTFADSSATSCWGIFTFCCGACVFVCLLVRVSCVCVYVHKCEYMPGVMPLFLCFVFRNTLWHNTTYYLVNYLLPSWVSESLVYQIRLRLLYSTLRQKFSILELCDKGMHHVSRHTDCLHSSKQSFKHLDYLPGVQLINGMLWVTNHQWKKGKGVDTSSWEKRNGANLFLLVLIAFVSHIWFYAFN